MKKVMQTVLLLSMSITLTTSCKKETFEAANITQDATHIENGLWVFNSQKEYYDKVLELASMSIEERRKWSEENNFVSPRIQFDRVIEAELKHEENSVKKLTLLNQSIEDLKKSPDYQEHSKLYLESLGSGLITETEEEDGGTSFAPKLINRSASYLTNTFGMIVIEGFLYQHLNSSIKVMKYDGKKSIEELKAASHSNEEKGITIILLEQKATTSFYRGDIFSPGSNSIIWYYNSSKERFKHSVHFTSSNFLSGGSSYVYCDYYTVSIAERKNIFGNWNVSSQYKPIKTLSGQSSYHYWKKKAGSFDPEIYSGSLPSGGAGATSPFSVEFGNANDVLIPLYPSGTFSITSPYYYYTPVDINSGSTWSGVFWGGPSGYTTNYNR